MAKQIIYSFRDPNSSDTFVPFWTFNENAEGKIVFTDRVNLDSENLTNISALATRIANDNTFWNEVDVNNPGYAPIGKAFNFLYINENGKAEWIRPQYDKTNWDPQVQLIKINNVINNAIANQNWQSQTVLQRVGDTADFILDLSNFLYEVNISLNPTYTPTYLMVPTPENET